MASGSEGFRMAHASGSGALGFVRFGVSGLRVRVSGLGFDLGLNPNTKKQIEQIMAPAPQTGYYPTCFSGPGIDHGDLYWLWSLSVGLPSKPDHWLMA